MTATTVAQALRLDRESLLSDCRRAAARHLDKLKHVPLTSPDEDGHYSRAALRLDRESLRWAAARHLDKLKHVPLTSRRGVQ
jgi:hypothetical protein